jgi:hypothetical protein
MRTAALIGGSFAVRAGVIRTSNFARMTIDVAL